MIRSNFWLAVFTGAYVLGAFAVSMWTGNYEFLMYVAQIMLIIGLILWADRRAHFTRGALWGLSVWGLLHMAGGLVPVPEAMAHLEGNNASPSLYDLWLIPPDRFKYDNLVHLYGFFVATIALWQAMRPFVIAGHRPTLVFAVLLSSAGMGLGAVNEIFEFIATRVFEETGVGGYVNNAMDLVYNAIGSVLAAGFLWWRWRSGFPAPTARPALATAEAPEGPEGGE